MSKTLELIVNLKLDGVVLPGYPLTKSKLIDETQQFDYIEASDGDTTTFSALPTGEVANIQVLVVSADKPITLRLDAQTDKGIRLAGGGLLVVFDATLDAGATTNAKVNVPGSVKAQVAGVAGGV